MGKKALLGLGAGAVAAGVLLALVLTQVFAPAITSNPALGGGVSVKLVVQVTRSDGTTETYVKKGDLVLQNFARLIVQATSGIRDPEDEDKLTREDGVTISSIQIRLGGKPGQIELGNGTAAPTLSDYKLGNKLVAFDVQDADIIVNGNNMTVDIFGAYTADKDMNITEIGLSFYHDQSYAGYYLLFHDVLNTPIALKAGDGITVHYYVNIINP